MKKIFALLLALCLVFSFAACGNSDGNGGNSGENGVDMSKYPTDINEWTAQNLVDYFFEAVDFPSDCVEDILPAEDCAGIPVHEMGTIWNIDGTNDVSITFFILDPNAADTTPEAVNEVRQAIIDDPNHNYSTEDMMLGTQDHMVGNVLFSYSEFTSNEEVYDQIEEAYENLVNYLGVKAEF